MHTQPRIALVVLVSLLAALAPAALAAQPATGALEGTAVSAETGAAIPFAIVRLLPAGGGAARQEDITSAEGRWRFVRVAAGEYRLQLLRIGFRPVLSPVLRVAGGEVVRHELRAAALPLQLPPMAVRPRLDCALGHELAEEPQLAALWEEARKGVELRRAFERRWRFARALRQDVELRMRLRDDRRRVRVDTTVNEPDSALVRERRQRELNARRGYGQGNDLVIPTEKEMLDPEFLQRHCLETAVEERDGALGVRFRPAETRRDGYGVRGTVWLDSATYLVRRIEYEHLDRGNPFSRVSVDYRDVAVRGSVLRLPAGGAATLSIRGAGRALASRADVRLTYTYWGFAEAGGR